MLRKKIYVFSALMLISVGVYAFSYSPDVWTHCLYGGVYTNTGEAAPDSGWCVITGTSFQDNHEVDVSECLSQEVPFADRCSGNGILRADVGPE